MPNAIMVIAPYWCKEVGTWVFDDERVGLRREPFVDGAPQIIDDLVRGIPNAREGFRLLFAGIPFPGVQKELIWVCEDCGGNRYRTEDPPMQGWLCPAMYNYFDEAPAKIYVKAEPTR